MPLTTGYLASAGTLYTKGTGGSRMTSLCAGALSDSADPVGDLTLSNTWQQFKWQRLAYLLNGVSRVAFVH